MQMNKLGRVTTLLLGVLMSAAVWAADPGIHEIYQAADAGNLGQAQQMIGQVLKDHPNSAKAHYVDAELLTRQHQLTQARAELATAEKLDPGLSFAKPAAVQALRAHLQPASHVQNFTTPATYSVPAYASNASSLPWGSIIGILALLSIAFLLARAMSRRTAPPESSVAPAYGAPRYGAPAYAGGGYAQAGYAPGYGPAPAAPGAGFGSAAGAGLGSGILGGLATGAAVGAGMVAGEALMHRVLDGGHASNVGNALAGNAPAAYFDDTAQYVDSLTQYDMGGQDFGIQDSTSWDDTRNSSDDWT
jgi:uncharacterized protein